MVDHSHFAQNTWRFTWAAVLCTTLEHTAGLALPACLLTLLVGSGSEGMSIKGWVEKFRRRQAAAEDRPGTSCTGTLGKSLNFLGSLLSCIKFTTVVCPLAPN